MLQFREIWVTTGGLTLATVRTKVYKLKKEPTQIEQAMRDDVVRRIRKIITDLWVCIPFHGKQILKNIYEIF